MNRHWNVTVGDAFDFVRNGKSLKQDRDAGGLPITRIETIADGQIDIERVGYAGVELVGNEQWLLQEGDILFSHINSVQHVGKCAIYEGTPAHLIHGMNLLALRPSKNLHPRYALHSLRQPAFRAQLLQFVNKAVNQASVSTTNLKSLPFSLPPLDEQRRIAAILDKADALRQKRKLAIALLDSLAQSIFLEMFGDPATNPSALNKIALGDLLKVKSGNGLTSNQMDGSGSHLVYGGNGPNGTHTSYMFDEPKIVIGRVGAYCGAVHVTKPKSWITDNALYVSDLKRPINQTYLAWALRMADLNQLAGRAAQPLISGGRIYPVEIFLPSASDQEKFDEALAAQGQLRTLINSGAIELLFASLQHRAFSGQL